MFDVIQDLCALHRAESSSVIKDGLADGYPEYVDFGKLRMRIRGLKPWLQELVARISQTYFYRIARDNQGRGPSVERVREVYSHAG